VEIDVVHALYTLRLLPGEDMPGVGVSLLEAGVDTPAIRELAGQESATLRDTGDLFERVLAELRRPEMAFKEAVIIVARDLARKVILGTMTAREAAQRGDSYCSRVQYHDALSPFVAYADDYECYPDRHAEIDAAVIKYSRELLAGIGRGAV
jgi:hypothetical protein